jgi:hypothetical protein
MQAFKRSGYVHQHLSIEAGRLMNASARMMGVYQDGLLTLAKVRSGGQQTVVVQHVNVGNGGQAVVAGQVKAGAKLRKGGSWWGMIRNRATTPCAACRIGARRSRWHSPVLAAEPGRGAGRPAGGQRCPGRHAECMVVPLQERHRGSAMANGATDCGRLRRSDAAAR